jgi:hypothetical protein
VLLQVFDDNTTPGVIGVYQLIRARGAGEAYTWCPSEVARCGLCFYSEFKRRFISELYNFKLIFCAVRWSATSTQEEMLAIHPKPL